MSLTRAIDEKEDKKPLHVDDFIDYGNSHRKEEREENEDYARWVLMHFRLSAIAKMAFDPFMRDHKLFCTYEGETFRVTGASRMGDVWLAKDFKRDTGYDHRVMVEACSNWRREP